MIAMLDSLRAESPKPILSSYPPAYEPGENEIRKDYVSRMIFNLFTQEGIVQCYQPPSPKRPRALWLSGGGLF